jgi:pyridoxal phosphate enzyme (YggS family)
MALSTLDSVAERLHRVRDEIGDAAVRAGREASDVRLVAISKGFPPQAVAAAMEAGQLEFGENRVQELESKYDKVPAGVVWHFVGALQRNKVRKLVRMASVIHSIDSRELAREVSSRSEGPIEVLIEVNASGEASKGGVPPHELNGLVEAVLEMEHLDLIGLMTMAPRVADPEEARPVFRQLAELRRQVEDRYSYARIHHLSMGMSQDYRVAVEEGSTMVRIGEAIFGPRDTRAK